jgi:hypothetical protein
MGFAGPRGASPPPSAPARGPNTASEPALWANELVTVPEGGVSGLVIALRPVLPLRGRLEFDGGAAPAAIAMANLIIGLQSVTPGSSSATTSTSARPGATGDFNLPGVAPGKYVVSSSTPAGFTAIESVVLGGVDVTDLPIDVSDRPLGDLAITWTNRPLGGLSIAVQPPIAVHAVDGSLAVVFPTDRKYWTEPLAARRRMRAVPLAIGGMAGVPDLPDGEYFVAILSAAEGETWMDASALAEVSRRAQRATIAGGQQSTIGVRR